MNRCRLPIIDRQNEEAQRDDTVSPILAHRCRYEQQIEKIQQKVQIPQRVELSNQEKRVCSDCEKYYQKEDKRNEKTI